MTALESALDECLSESRGSRSMLAELRQRYCAEEQFLRQTLTQALKTQERWLRSRPAIGTRPSPVWTRTCDAMQKRIDSLEVDLVDVRMAIVAMDGEIEELAQRTVSGAGLAPGGIGIANTP